MNIFYNFVKINFDFDFDTKQKYFSVIDAASEDFQISLFSNDNLFYEINNATSVSIVRNQSFILNNVNKPFVYIKNIGNRAFPIYASSKDTSTTKCIYNFENYFENENVLLNPNESIIIYIDSSQDGSVAISKAFSPFGFSYNFPNIEEINKLGNYPIACNNEISTFSYLDSKLNTSFYDKSNLEITLSHSGLDRILHSSENNTSNFIGTFQKNEEIKNGYLRNKDYCSNFDMQCNSILLNTCFYINNLPESGKKYHLYSFGDYDCLNNYVSKFNAISINHNGDIEVGETSGYCYPVGFENIQANPCRIISNKSLVPCSWNNVSLIKCKNFAGLIVNNNYDGNNSFITGACICTNLINLSNNCDLNNSQTFDGCILNFKVVNDNSLPEIFECANSKFSVNFNAEYGECIYSSDLYTLGTLDFTIEFWMNICGFKCTTGSEDNVQTILSASNGVFDLRACYESCSNQWSLVDNGLISISPISTGTWYHVYLQRNNCYRTLAARGNNNFAIMGSTNDCSSYECFSLLFGKDINPGSTGFNGLLSNIRIASNCGIYEADYFYPKFPLTEIVCRCNGLVGYGNDCTIPSNVFIACFFGSIGSNSSQIYYVCSGSYQDLKGKLSYVSEYPEIKDCWNFCPYSMQNLINQIPNNQNDLYVDFDLLNYSTSGLIQNISNFVHSGICVDFNLKYTGNIDISQRLGDNNFESKIILNCISIYKDDDYYDTIYPNNLNFNLCKIVTGDINYCFLYNIDVCSEKKYKYIFSGDISENSSSYFEVYKTSNFGSELFSGIFNTSEITLINNNECSPYVCAKLYKDDSIKNLYVSDVQVCDFYLPDSKNFNYLHCYKLMNSNGFSINSINGFNWIDSGSNFIADSGCIYSGIPFKNNISIINNQDCLYLENTPQNNCLFLNVCQNRCSTLDYIQKDNSDVSEPFNLIYDSNYCSLFYDSLEFRYFPAIAASYQNSIYTIPDGSHIYTFNYCGNYINIELPKRAINSSKFKITSDFEIIDFANYICSEIRYGDLKYENSICGINQHFIQIPKIKYSGNYIAPEVSIKTEINSLIQKEVKFYVNYVEGKTCDPNYGLNNLLNYINSKLNSGIAISCTGCFVYGDENYDLFMAELDQEVEIKCFSKLSGDWTNINNALYFCNFSQDEPLMYKAKSGIGYNFIVPISDRLTYNDIYVDIDGREQTGNINLTCNTHLLNISEKYASYVTGSCYLSGTGYIYNCGTGYICTSGIGTIYESGTGYIYDMDEFGQITGCHTGNVQIESTGWVYDQYTGYIITGCSTGNILTGILNDYGSGGSFYKFLNSYIFDIDSKSLDLSSGNRSINLCQNYLFSGVQPIYINSNYGLSQIKSPLLTCSLIPYECSLDSFSGLFYYVYDFSKIENKPIIFVSHPSTIIECITWTDSDGEKQISLNNENKKYGSFKNTVSIVNYNATGLINSNLNQFDQSYKDLTIKSIGGI